MNELPLAWIFTIQNVFLFNVKVYSEEGQEEDFILELLIMCSQSEFGF